MITVVPAVIIAVMKYNIPMHAESSLNGVQKAGAPHKTAKKMVAEIQGVLRVLEKQSNHLFFWSDIRLG